MGATYNSTMIKHMVLKMWERSRNKKNGTFSFTVWDERGCVVATRAGFKTYQEADLAAEHAQREYLFPSENLHEMTDDEILHELGLI